MTFLRTGKKLAYAQTVLPAPKNAPTVIVIKKAPKGRGRGEIRFCQTI